MENKLTNNKNYYYLCERCSYKTFFISEIKRHINRKHLCKAIENFNLNDIEWKERSLEKKIIKNNEKEEEKDDNKEKPFCEHCNTKFSTTSSLNRHIKICKKKPNVENINITNTNNNFIINNIQNNNNNNIFVFNFNENNMEEESMKDLILPFYSKFDISHLSDNEQIKLVIDNLHVNALNILLKNKLNLNYFLLDNKEKSLIYKNKEEKMVVENKVVIYENLWNKLTNTFLDILEKIRIQTPYQNPKLYEFWKNLILEKHNNFISKKNEKDFITFVEGVNTVNEMNKERFKIQYKTINEKFLKDFEINNS